MKKFWALVLAAVLLLTALPALAETTHTSGLYTYEIKENGTVTITGFDWETNGNADVFVPDLIDGYTVTGIGDEAFKYESKYVTTRSNAVAITLPDGITSIGSFAFWNTNLSEINIPDNVEFIGDGAFVGCPECIFKTRPNQPAFAVIDKALYNKHTKELIAYYRSDGLTIPEGIVSIGNYALYGRRAYGERNYGIVELPSTLMRIGDYAFAKSELCSALPYSLDIPDTVETIGKGAFAEIVAPLPTQLSVGYGIFISDKSSLREISEDAFRNTFPSFISCAAPIIESVGAYAFYDSVIFDLDISHIKSWGEYAFDKGYVCDYHLDFSGQIIPLNSELNIIPAGFNVPGILPETVTELSSEAYTYQVEDFTLPASINKIATDAFPKGSTFVVEAGSYAERWCNENGFGYSLEGQDKLDWLNN